MNNLWHRSTVIFVINQKKEFIVQKRSSIKDYCPGYIDLASGGCVGIEEDEDTSAMRELNEELGIEDVEGPNFLFKYPYIDDNSRVWSYVYYKMYYGQVKPDEKEIDALFFWNEEKIMEKI